MTGPSAQPHQGGPIQAPSSQRRLFLLRKVAASKSLKVEGSPSLWSSGLRIRLPMQGTWIQSLVPTCHGATKPVHPNY